MNTTTRQFIIAHAHAAKAAGADARRRRDRLKELQALSSAGAIVLTGLLLAALYCLLTHQIHA